MGICSSKSNKSGGQQAAAAEAPLPAAGTTPAEAERSSRSVGGNSTTGTASDAGGTEAHTYNSAEKPCRSAMRPSLDGPGLAARSPGVRRTSLNNASGSVSSVGFNVSVDAPDAEIGDHASFSGSDSISLKKIVDMFYEKVLATPALAYFFNDIDMQKLKKHQVRFMGLAFGGKELVFEEDPNLNLRKVHYRLIKDKGLSLEHWEVFVGLFEKTLEQLAREIPQETRAAAKRSIHATKHYFVPIGEETKYTNSSIAAMPVADA